MTTHFTVSSQDEMLALIAVTGDLAERTDISKTFILSGSDPTILGDWSIATEIKWSQFPTAVAVQTTDQLVGLRGGVNVRLNNVPSDSNVVHKTGIETISGIKTFTDPVAADITGNAATVTTNANLTGPVKSIGNATEIKDAAVTLPKLQDISALTILGNSSGISGQVVEISTTNSLSLTGNDLKSTVVGVDSNTVDLSSILPPATTNTLVNNGDNTITSTVDGVGSTTGVIINNGLYLLTNLIGSIINGLDSGPVDIISTNALSLTGTNLKSSVNTLDSNTVDIQIPIASPTNNNLVSMDSTGHVKDAGASITTSAVSNDNTHVMTSAATQSAISTAITSGRSFRGGYDASTNLFPAIGGSGVAGAILAGDNWIITVAGTLGGTPVLPNDTILSLIDTPGQTSSNWIITEPTVQSVFGRMGTVVSQTGDYTVSQVTGAAPLASPALTGTPTAPTQTQGDNSTNVATTAYVDTGLSPKAPLASPALTGTPTAPTASPGTNTTQVATTAFVTAAAAAGVISFNTRTGAVSPTTGDYSVGQITGAAPLASPTLTGTPAAPTASPGTNTTQISTTAFVTTADNLKANIASPSLTGVPTAPTASPGTNTTQLATTAFVAASAAAGVTSFNSRSGAVIPATADYTVAQVTGAAPLASPTFTGTPSAPTPTISDNTTKLATTEFVTTAIGAYSIKIDVQKSSVNTSLTNQTEVIVAVAPLLQSNGYYVLEITDVSNGRQLTVHFQLCANRYNIGYPPSSTVPYAIPTLVITSVNDSGNTITAANVNQYLTFISRVRTTNPNPYVAVTVKMSGGLLNASSTLTYTCTSYADSFLQDNSTVTQYIAQKYSNLDAVAASISYGIINTTYMSPVTTYGANLFLYCVNFSGNTISMYTINTVTGLLTNNSPATLASGTSPRNIITSKDGRYAYATNSSSTNIQMMLLDVATGLLTNNSTPTIGAGINPSYLAIFPAQQNFLYVTNRGSATVGGYFLDRTTGLLSLLSPATTSVGNNPIGIAITNATSPYMYVANNVTGTINMFQINPANGALSPLSPTTVSQSGAYHIVLHPSGLYLYVSSDTGSVINVFSINTATGILTSVQLASSGTTTREMAITPNGSFLYAINNGSNNFQVYTVNAANGQLTSAGTVSLTNPTSIKTSPNGLFLYVSSGTSNNVTAYSINQTTGIPTSVGSISAGSNSFSICIL